jgi:hypothetical protein
LNLSAIFTSLNLSAIFTSLNLSAIFTSLNLSAIISLSFTFISREIFLWFQAINDFSLTLRMENLLATYLF